MELFTEQAVINPNIDNHKKRTLILAIARHVCIAIIFIMSFILTCFLPLNEDINPILSFLLNFLLMAFLSLPFVGSVFLLTFFINFLNVEYDYIIHGSFIRIVRIFNRKKRKLIFEASVDYIQSIGKYDSEAFKRISYGEHKSIYAILNKKMPDAEKTFYLYSQLNGEKTIVYFEPSEQMLASLKKAIGRMTVFTA